MGVCFFGCTHNKEGEDQAQQGEQPPALDPHQDERCHSIGLDKDLTLEGRCGAAWGVLITRTKKVQTLPFMIYVQGGGWSDSQVQLSAPEYYLGAVSEMRSLIKSCAK